jgi:lathosterol oxidase
MITALVDNILYEYSYPQLYVLVFLYFIFLYYALAPVFLWGCKLLSSKNIVHKIVDKEVSQKQIHLEKKHSLKSILIFGFSALPVIYLVRINALVLLPDTTINIIIGILILTIWNEVHFFVVHRIMHFPFFMKNVHAVHHKSIIPTVYSVYSFHWLEALLLSTVPITIVLIIPLSPIAIFLYPLASILLNYAGHCNYRFGDGQGADWKLFGSHHNDHHVKFTKNYGFASNLLDKINDKLRQMRLSQKR